MLQRRGTQTRRIRLISSTFVLLKILPLQSRAAAALSPTTPSVFGNSSYEKLAEAAIDEGFRMLYHWQDDVRFALEEGKNDARR